MSLWNRKTAKRKYDCYLQGFLVSETKKEIYRASEKICCRSPANFIVHAKNEIRCVFISFSNLYFQTDVII